jgi:YesN/AraC family two-component response regulator
VDCALDGKKALSLIKKQDYDIVFLDINMPELGGVEILRYVKDNNMKAKVVFLTGYPCINENFAKALRADEYLDKPVDLKVISEIIDNYMSS